MTRTVPTLMHWGAYRLTVDGDAITDVAPLLDDPEPSRIGRSLTESRTARVERPAVRRSWLERGPGADTDRRGEEAFVELPWDEVLDLVAAELARVRDVHGNAAIYAGSYGWASAGRFHHAQSQLKRFLTLFGGFTGSVGTYSHGAAEAAVPRITGLSLTEFLAAHPPADEVAAATELVVSFGGIPAPNAQIASGGSGTHVTLARLRDAAARGCRFVSVSPTRSALDAELGAEWLPIVPGTDVAVMLALLHVLVEDGRADLVGLERRTSGSEVLLDHLAGRLDGRPKDPAWASAVSGLDAGRIRDLAHELVDLRSLVNVAFAIQRADHGEQALWALVALATAVGQLDRPGGGMGFGYGSMQGVGAPVCRPAAPTVPTGGVNAVASPIPVARVADMLLDPGGTYRFDGATHRYPRIALVWWAGGNPYHHHQDLERLARAWQVPETVIVSEPFWTATARRADIVLPTTTPLERRDLGGGASDAHLIAMEPALAPHAEARDDHAILADLAERLGLRERFTEGRDVDGWLTAMYERFRSAEPSLPDEATFRAAGSVARVVDTSARDRWLAFLADPEASPLPTPTGRIVLGVDDPDDDRPAHPRWDAPAEWLGDAPDGMLHLLTVQPRHQLHGQYDFADEVRRHRDDGRARIELHPDDAAARGIARGDVVLVHNARGRCYASADLTDDVRPGVAVLPTGAWWDRALDDQGRPVCLRGNPNVLTRDVGTSVWGQATSAHTCLVAVERVDVAPPPRPHGPPELVARA